MVNLSLPSAYRFILIGIFLCLGSIGWSVSYKAGSAKITGNYVTITTSDAIINGWLVVKPKPYTFSVNATTGPGWETTEDPPSSVSLDFTGCRGGQQVVFVNFETLKKNADGSPDKTDFVSVRVFVVEAEISEIDRIPIYGGLNPIEETATVTVKPGPLNGVQLKLSTEGGSGSAVFDNGQKIKPITQQTTVVKIRGVDNSTTKDNIKLSVTLDGKELAKEYFSVRTWPVNFRQNSVQAINGKLIFVYIWESESGNLNHLADIKIGEKVNYPGGNPYVWPIPWDYVTDNPTEIENFANLFIQDVHSPGDFFTPYQAGSASSSQIYRFRDPILDPNNYYIVLGPHTINRSVSLIGTNWVYTILKTGCSTSKILE